MIPTARFLLVTTTAVSSIVSAAAQAPADSVSTDIQLQEVVVQAAKVIRRPDMDVYYPAVSAVEQSTNAMTLLGNMLIPSLSVNTVMETIRTAGQDVQLRINGREATMAQVKAILPQSVKRVEYIENPGLRYGDAVAVINFIVSNPDSGGALMLSAMQALTQPWGNYNADLQLNFGKSQLTLGAFGKLSHKLDMYREYSERFTYADGTSLTRDEKPLGGYVSGDFLTPSVGYSYIDPDKTTVWIGAGFTRDMNNGTCYHGLMSLSDGSDDIALTDYSMSQSTTPWASAYFERKLPRKQTLVASASMSYVAGDNLHSYLERIPGQDTDLTDISTDIRDHNQAYRTEVNYIKQWNRSKFTAGASYSANRNRSTYRNLGNAVFHQTQDRIYLFGEYFRRVGRVNLTGGMGAQFTDIASRESGTSSHTWSWRPRFTASYRFCDAAQYRLYFQTWTTAPTLSQTNAVPQQIDGFQYRVGNPNLRPYANYRVSAYYNYSFPRVEGSLYARWGRSVDAVTPFMQWQGDKLVTSYDNGGAFTRWEITLSPQVVIVPGWLNVEGSLRFSHQKSNGSGYTHIYNGWSGDVTLMAMHWNWTFLLQYENRGGELWGETIEHGEKIGVVALQYQHGPFQFMAGMLMPFARYSYGSQLLSAYNSNKYTMRGKNIEKMPVLKISYNLQWGKQKRRATRLIDGDADVQTSKAAAR